MRIISICHIFIFYLFFSSICQSQSLTGVWSWKSEKYHGTAQFDSTLFHNTIYFPNSDNKVLETYQYYIFEKNKIYLSDEPFSASTDKKTKTVIKVKKGDSDKQLIVSTNIGDEVYEKKSETCKVTRNRPNEIYLVNNKLQCYGENEKPANAGNCLCIAGVSFYSKYEEIIQKYGRPSTTITNPDNSQTLYFIAYPKEKKSPLLGITFKENEIIKIELAGYKSHDDFSFSSIRLGDYYTYVKSKLGEPHYKKEVKAAGDETWVYMPVPITIEFRLNKVSSISIEPFQLEKQ